MLGRARIDRAPRRTSLWTAILALLFVAAGCVSAGRQAGGAALLESIALQVTNQSPVDVVVYLAEGTVPLRLGRVQALGRTRLNIRGSGRTDRPVRLVLLSGSGESYAPESVWAAAGEVLELTIRSLLTTSDVVVRVGRG